MAESLACITNEEEHRHSELIVNYNIGLKTLLQQGISEPIFYGS